MASKKMFTVLALVLCIAYFAECGVIETNETGDSGKCNKQLDYPKQYHKAYKFLCQNAISIV